MDQDFWTYNILRLTGCKINLDLLWPVESLRFQRAREREVWETEMTWFDVCPKYTYMFIYRELSKSVWNPMVFFSNPRLSLCRRHCQHRWPDGEHQISGQRASHFSKPLCLKMTVEAVELPLNVWHVPFFVFFCWSLAKHLYQMELYEWFCLGFELLPVSSNKYKHYWCE